MNSTTVDHAAVFKALGDPNRLAIFQLILACGERACSPQEACNSISRIAARFELSLSTVSHHIKELRAVGLVRCDKQGQTVYCSAVPDVLAEAARGLLEVRA